MEYVVNDDTNGENSDSDTETNDENVENKAAATNGSSNNNTGSHANGTEGVLQKQQSADSDIDNTTTINESTDNKQSAKIGMIRILSYSIHLSVQLLTSILYVCILKIYLLCFLYYCRQCHTSSW
jgi:hypothetical protein